MPNKNRRNEKVKYLTKSMRIIFAFVNAITRRQRVLTCSVLFDNSDVNVVAPRGWLVLRIMLVCAATLNL